MSSDTPSRVLYIMGTARSASTILEVLLANNPGVVGAGELSHLFADGFSREAPCSCGEPLERCEQFRPVFESFRDESERWSEHADLFRRIEWHRGFWRQASGLGSRNARYEELNRRILDALGPIEWIVDSSKYAGRALALSRAFPDRVWCVCLTRSPRGLLHAFTKRNVGEQEPKSILGVVAYFVFVALCLRLASWRLRRRVLFMKYEDLLRDPAAELERLSRWCGLNVERARARLASNEDFSVGHIVTGNRLRREGRVRFRNASGEPTPLTASQGLAVTVMNAFARIVGIPRLSSQLARDNQIEVRN